MARKKIATSLTPDTGYPVTVLKRGNWNGRDKLVVASTFMEYDKSDGALLLDWWQKAYIINNYRFLVVNKSRRVGWSFSTALKGLLNAIDPAKSNYTKQFVSYSLEDAKEKISIARTFFLSIPETLRPKKLVSDSKTVLEWEDVGGKTTSRLISWPCKAPRGKGGDISLDEFAFHANDTQIYTAALPIISRGGNLEIGSTPFGNKGKFYDILANTAQYPEFVRNNIPWYYSPALCVDVEEAQERAREFTTEQLVEKYGTEIIKTIFNNMSLEEFQQEYECSFRDELAAFITLEMIQRCTPLGGDEENPEDTREIVPFHSIDDLILGYRPDIHKYLYAGYDVGRTNDASELTVLGYNPDTGLRTVWASISYKKTGFEEQERNLMRLMSSLPIYRLCIDGTGLGMQLGETLVKRFPRKAESVQFNNQIKAEMSEALWLIFDKQRIALPPDRELQQQIHSIKKTSTTAKYARFDCDANEHHHADKYWSLALANHAIGNGVASGGFYQQYSQRKGKHDIIPKIPKDVATIIAATRRVL
jgi:phage FluMu gp28-like protein